MQAKTRLFSWRRCLAWSVSAIVLPGVAMVGLGVQQHFHLKRFGVVREGVLYRMGQPTQVGWEHAIRNLKIRTVICTRVGDPALRAGVWDRGESDGPLESVWVGQLGARHRLFPIGSEAYWPWPSPDQFEDLFDILDDPKNHPVAVHCMGGRHRTGTFVALFRLEYDGWPIEPTLAEMYSFDFGEPNALQDLNLRTYLPRPLPEPHERLALQQAFAEFAPSGLSDDPLQRVFDHSQFVKRLARRCDEPELERRLTEYVAQRRPFAIPLMQAVLQEAADRDCSRLRAAASETALVLLQSEARSREWSAAAALIADVGDDEQRQRLLRMIEDEPRTGPVGDRYYSIVLGLASRYVPNRLPLLLPTLNDVRPLPIPHRFVSSLDGETTYEYRICDIIVARNCVVTAENPIHGNSRSAWEDARARLRAWYEANPQAKALVGFERVPVHRAAVQRDLLKFR